jgi:nucleoside phosphorylase
MTSLTLAQLKGTIDFGIITIRPDEYEAILEWFPGTNNSEGERNYRISDVLTNEAEKVIRVAIVRCNEPGLGEAQTVANNMITDLAPECVLAVGIAGGIPDADFSLGDVIIATHIHDFSVEAVLSKDREFNIGGGPVPRAVQNVAVSLKAYEGDLGDWAHNIQNSIEVPPVKYQNPDNYYGPKDWREKVRRLLEKRFGTEAKRRSPKVVDGPIASSDRLIKDVEITEKLLSFVRNTKAVEMEVAGVYRAARGTKKDYLVTTIRGISDVIGFKRDDSWTKYACQTAAAFTYAFVKSGLLIKPKSSSKK